MKEDICKRIAIIRNNLGMNKNEFADFLGVSPQYVGAVEKKENCLSIEKIIILAKKANVSTDYILLGKTTSIDETLLNNLNNISEEDLNSYINVIKQIISLVKKHN